MSFMERRKVLMGVLAGFAAGTVAGAGGHRIWTALGGPKAAFRDVLAQVVPREGIPTGLVFGDVLQKIIAAGVLEPAKLRSVYAKRGGLPPWVAALLTGPSDAPIRLSAETAPYLLTLLWPVGLATRASFNADSPTNGKYLPRLASTAGWTLGREANGAAYFDKVDALTLTPAREALVQQVAERTFRPCCDNSALFQDCNHGSAMLGFLELGISQDVPRDKLLRLAKALNGYWYPDKYIAMALVFARRDGISWNNVPSEKALGADYSSLSGWRTNVARPLAKFGILPRRGNGAPRSSGCAL